MPSRPEIIADLERSGADSVRRTLERGHYGEPLRSIVVEWLAQKDAAAARSSRAEEIDLARRAADAALDAAESARSANDLAREANSVARDANSLAATANSLSSRANNRSRDANKIAIAAVVVAAISAAISIMAIFLR